MPNCSNDTAGSGKRGIQPNQAKPDGNCSAALARHQTAAIQRSDSSSRSLVIRQHITHPQGLTDSHPWQLSCTEVPENPQVLALAVQTLRV